MAFGEIARTSARPDSIQLFFSVLSRRWIFFLLVPNRINQIMQKTIVALLVKKNFEERAREKNRHIRFAPLTKIGKKSFSFKKLNKKGKHLPYSRWEKQFYVGQVGFAVEKQKKSKQKKAKMFPDADLRQLTAREIMNLKAMPFVLLCVYLATRKIFFMIHQKKSDYCWTIYKIQSGIAFWNETREWKEEIIMFAPEFHRKH